MNIEYQKIHPRDWQDFGIFKYYKETPEFSLIMTFNAFLPKLWELILTNNVQDFMVRERRVSESYPSDSN